MPAPRIALAAFMLESNAHSPVATKSEFATNYLCYGGDMVADWKGEHPRRPKTQAGFVARPDDAEDGPRSYNYTDMESR